MLIDDDATSPLRLWPQVELGIKRLKHLKKKSRSERTVQYVEKSKQPRSTWENTFGHKGAKS